ncbi:hypothetical protein [Desulfosarcina ovata]|uniref:SLA1 homology domain-containing protein n=2 Tax=Desulfosarcina ovata TaxID=83564 RepID=A0A5K8AF91_9BACT|nr:hypothetical protein [Desulfosarcina ovata]BBO84755.1 hypothetical protein DSCO28_53210 [Desulfosarcina ovata subsp. sediminis]BBO91257.1 hypothetical protein DSCOOX_44370 [Desulfosarcina ovata subsp. ovata]
MLGRSLIFFTAVALLAVTGPAAADILILKSGEMFETQKTWTENGQVYFYKGGRQVSVAEDQVERMIHAPVSAKPAAPTVAVPALPDLQLPSRGTAEDQGGDIPAPGGDAGFIELKWGQPPSQIRGLVLVETDPAYGGVNQYSRPQRAARFGRASVDNIFYGFWRGRLFTILVEVSNYLDFTALKAEAVRRYGQGRHEASNLDRYRWSDATTDRFLTYDEASGTGYLWMRSRTLQNEIAALYPE